MHPKLNAMAIVGSSLLSWLGGVHAAEETAFLGVQLVPIPEDLAAHLGNTEGAMIAEVSPESPAARAGLKKHDVVMSVAGESLKGLGALRKKIREMQPGEELLLSSRRGGETKELKVPLGSAQASPVLQPEGE